MLWWSQRWYNRRLGIMHVSSLALLFLLLHSSLQQSGYFPDAEDDEEPEKEMQADFDCFSKIHMENVFLLCNVTKLPPRKVENIIFQIRDRKKPWRENKHVTFPLDLGRHKVCIAWEKSQHCKDIDVNIIDFDCFSKIRIEKVFLLCNITKLPPREVENINFKIRGREPLQWSENKHVTFPLDLGRHKVCIVWEKSQHCKDIDVNKIAIPDSPNNITITYNRESEEYLFNISFPYKPNDYLRGCMDQELVLRKEGTAWPDCTDETTGGYKLCFKKIQDDLYVPKRNLEYSTKYKVRVRSIPNGKYYAGFWSPWSATSTFQTEEETVSDTGNLPIYSRGSILPVTLSISIPFFLLIIVILIAVFWKSKIKPFIWPEIPDHKKTLEKFCNKPKQNFLISFNPDYYEIIPIHKIDYIKAKEIPEDNPEMGTPDSSLGKPPNNACTFNLSPSEGSRRLLSHNNGQSKNLDDHEENTSDSGTVALLPGDGVSEKCNPSNVSNGMTSMTVKQPGNGLKGLCWEDIYIAMSAFKTPSSAVKQVPKNTF